MGRAAVAIAGEVISEGARRAALVDITRVLGRAERLAGEVPTSLIQARARAPFQLVDTPPGVASRFLERFEDAALWVDEGNCFNRAMLGAHMLDEVRGFGMNPLDDVFAGAVAIKRQHVAERYVADFHAALAIKVRHVDELQVIDMVPGSRRMQPLSSWAPGETPIVVRPFAGTGVNGRSDWVGAGYFRGAADNLAATWRDAETFDVTVRRLGSSRSRPGP